MSKTGRISWIFVLATIVGLAFSCANPVTPTGGAKDVTPPEVVKSEPPNYSPAFKKKKITITFSEFIKLKQITQQVVISPPLAEFPEFTLKGKSLLIDISGELSPNTTYSVFFGNSVIDITESNPLADFRYVFSTGDYVDSLSIAGEVHNAFTGKPEKEVFVMLYLVDNDTVPADSLPYLVRPRYVAKTDNNGIFRFMNLGDNNYKLFALKDVNSNYLFDQPNEEIGFIDSLISPEYVNFPEIDRQPGDTAVKDTVIVSSLYKNYHQVMLFQQMDSVQRLLDDMVLSPGRYRLAFRYPVGQLSVDPVDRIFDSIWKITEFNGRRDTLMIWFTNPGIDSLMLRVADDTLVLDTLTYTAKKIRIDKKKRREKEVAASEKLVVGSNVKSRFLEPDSKLKIYFDDPLKTYDFRRSLFITDRDTITSPGFYPTDSINRHFSLDTPMKEETDVEVVFPDSSFQSIYGTFNDSLRLVFRVMSKREFGNILLEVKTGSDYPYILQLLTNKEEIVREFYTGKSGILEFNLVKPGKYIIKAIQDKWINKRWDTGNYSQKRQPESVFYLPDEIEVRANWDIEKSLALP